jgi:ketosteroid isomerase-like protein
MPTFSDGDVVRRLYQAIADRDFVAAESCFAEDVVWHLPGNSPIAGDHHGWPQIRDNFMAKLGPLSGGTSGSARRLLALARHEPVLRLFVSAVAT